MIVHRFLLVSLSIETILGETTIRRRREKLKQMSKGQNVGDVYTATFERIRTQGEDRARLGMEAIMWIAYSERPLGPGELCQALGVEIGSTDLDNDNAPSIRTILNCGLGLVAIDSSSSKARLVHFTLQEHIIANPTLFCTPHSMIAEVCLTYLNFGCIRDLPPDLDPLPPTTPFLEYASRYWGAHAGRQTSASVISLALTLLDGFDAHISCELLLRNEYLSGPAPLDCTALHAGAFLGVLEIMTSLLKMDKWDLNATDCHGRTPLMCATEVGHDAIVKVLLEQEGVDPHIVDDSGRTPLSRAAGNGHERIVEMLLVQNDVNPDTADEDGRTPLSWAAEPEFMWGTEEERERVVKILLERSEVNPGSTDKNGRTPLSWAAESGFVRGLQMLLERSDVNPDSADKNGRTPLSWAAESGFAGGLQMLLERSDVNPDSADKSGRTPLSWAAGAVYISQRTEEEHERVIKILLERNDVNPDRADKSGRTPLSWAAGPRFQPQDADNIRGRIVRILLERNDVNPDSADKNGQTPLSWAAESGLTGVLRTLLERNDVNPDRPDKSGRTPLSWAAGPRVRPQGVDGEWEGAVRILLERNDVNPHSADTSGRTPLSWAASNGSAGVLRMLLERNDINPDRADKSGRPPLSSMAVVNEDEEVKEMLPVLQRNHAHPDTENRSTVLARFCLLVCIIS